MTIDILLQSAPTLIVVVGVLGLVVGSFLNVVIHRLPLMLERTWKRQCQEYLGEASSAPLERFDLILPRSRCPHCGHAISAWENIPLLSFLWLRGRCRGCSARISARYPAVELLSGGLSALLAWHFGFTPALAAALLLSWALIALTFIDYDHQLLPDAVTLPFLWLGLGINLFNVFTPLHAAVIGAIAGYLALWLVYYAFKWLTGKEGMGFGDFKLFALAGAWLGWQALPLVILLASAAGAVIGIGLILLRRHDRTKPLPFGPFLCVAIWIALLWGDSITRMYLRASGIVV